MIAIPQKYGFDLTKSFSQAPAFSTSPATADETFQSSSTAALNWKIWKGPKGMPFRFFEGEVT
jgi:hypothetical protein